jgi:hypothetical protein
MGRKNSLLVLIRKTLFRDSNNLAETTVDWNWPETSSVQYQSIDWLEEQFIDHVSK